MVAEGKPFRMKEPGNRFRKVQRAIMSPFMFLGLVLFFAAEGAGCLTCKHVGRRAAADAEICGPRPGHPSCSEELGNGFSTSCLGEDLLSVLPSAWPEKLRPPA